MANIMTKFLLPILIFFFSPGLTAQTTAPTNKLNDSNVYRLENLAEDLIASNPVEDIIPWYVKEDKDSISIKLKMFQSDLQQSKDSISYYLQRSIKEGSSHSIRFIYNDDTPHSSIHVLFPKKDTIASTIQIDNWYLTQKISEEYESQSKGVWDIPPPPMPPLKPN